MPSGLLETALNTVSPCILVRALIPLPPLVRIMQADGAGARLF